MSQVGFASECDAAYQVGGTSECDALSQVDCACTCVCLSQVGRASAADLGQVGLRLALADFRIRQFLLNALVDRHRIGIGTRLFEKSIEFGVETRYDGLEFRIVDPIDHFIRIRR